MGQQRNDEDRGAPIRDFAPRDLYVKQVEQKVVANLVLRGKAEGMSLGEVLRALVYGYANGDISIIENKKKLKAIQNDYLKDHKEPSA